MIQRKTSVSKRSILKFALVAPLLFGGMEVNAADWLMLQGIQPDMVAPKGVLVPYRSKVPKVWGFIQANYKKDFGEVFVTPPGAFPNDGLNKTPFSYLNPNLEDQSGFNVFRARLALRGMADNDNLVNYFFMTEFGNSAVNNLAGHDVATYFTDASITLKHIPGAKVRVGMFKTPGSEEGLQAVFVSPYIEFTTMTNQQLLERQVSNVGAAQNPLGEGITQYTSTSVDKPIAAFRDVGVQIFDTFKLQDDWTLSYAYMYGNGTGISHSSSNKQATNYGYLALEKNFGKGKGYYTEAMKFYVWGQDGKRTLDSYDGNVTTEVDANRQRYGVGMTYYHNGLRFEAEYMKAKGMIFAGPTDIDHDPSAEDWQFQFATGDENEADGGYVNLQYEIIPKKFEVFGRYDYCNRLTNTTKNERKFKTTTVGASYRYRGATRIDLNYIMKDGSAPGFAKAQDVLDNMGNRIAVQITAAF
ncbi:MAG: OprO/OprP family phosphate-selective porin [Sulfurovum sp.]|nr:OprO/OprP family phosphate-selective porin [Sulfurovum sp.]